MKKFFLPLLSLLFILSCNQMSETDKTIVDFIKKNSHNPSSVELLSSELFKTQTISDIYKDYLKTFADEGEKEILINKSSLIDNKEEVSYCYKVSFRAKNAMDAVVLNNMYILFDKDMKPIAIGDGLMGLNSIQMKKLLF